MHIQGEQAYCEGGWGACILGTLDLHDEPVYPKADIDTHKITWGEVRTSSRYCEVCTNLWPWEAFDSILWWPCEGKPCMLSSKISWLKIALGQTAHLFRVPISCWRFDTNGHSTWPKAAWTPSFCKSHCTWNIISSRGGILSFACTFGHKCWRIFMCQPGCRMEYITSSWSLLAPNCTSLQSGYYLYHTCKCIQ